MGADEVSTVLRQVTASLPHGGEDRPGQVQMGRAVARALRTGRHLIVQAGTGTGKSLAYLVPAVVSGERVVVATATKALQDQLAQKDLPLLAAALDRPVTFAVLKGRSNYLCLERAEEVGGRGVQQRLGAAADVPPADVPQTDVSRSDVSRSDVSRSEVSRSDVSQSDVDLFGEDGTAAREEPVETGRLVDDVRRLLSWSLETETGDRADLDFEPHDRAWAMVSVGPRECPGAHRCPEGSRCFAERARRRAAEADVVVVNTHLYGAHLASGGAVLPAHDAVVFDEAHELEAVMTQSLGVDLAPGRLHALHMAARALLDDSEPSGLEDAADRLRALLAARVGHRVLRARGGDEPAGSPRARARDRGERGRDFFGLPGDADAGTGRDGRDGGGRGGDGRGGRGGVAAGTRAGSDEDASDAELAALLELTLGRLQRVRARLVATSSAEGGAAHGESQAGDPARTTRALTATAHLEEDMGRLLAPGEDDVVWVDGTPRGPVLRLSPVDVGPILAGALWGSVSAVLTSATIPPHLAERLQLDHFDVDHLDVGSPFDFRSHALLYVARHLPDPRSDRAQAAVWDELEALITAAGGRTLALFTSRRATADAAGALASRVPFRLLVQGDLPKPRLLEAFAGDETSCLFATLGFWQGVDVPGRALSLVALDRLPFGRPGDPVLDARREAAGQAAFALVDLPRTATLLAQGVGRLVRTATDRGVVAVLDPRLATAGYRRALLDALPPMRRTVDRAEVVAFLKDAVA